MNNSQETYYSIPIEKKCNPLGIREVIKKFAEWYDEI